MTTQPQYLQYLESAKRGETADRLRSEGYSVEEEKRVGDVIFDLFATKNGRTTVYEFKSAGYFKSSGSHLRYLQEAARKAGFDFRVVVANPPPRVHVEVENLADQLQKHMIDENFPQELDELSTHASIDRISDIDISNIYVGNGEIRVSGRGNAEVALQYESSSADGVTSSDAFPFHFSAVLSPDGRLKSVEQLTVDTSSFYE